MAQEPIVKCTPALQLVTGDDETEQFSGPIDTRKIFREMILDEIRRGRLTKARRKRIMQYAACLQFSAVEVVEMITQCRDELLQSANPEDQAFALKLAAIDPATENQEPSDMAVLGWFTLKGFTVALYVLAGLMFLAQWMNK